MARTRDEKLHEQRREQILLAAAHVFKAKGFHLARTDDICTQSGISAGTVFRYFQDKRAMINAIAEIEYENYKHWVHSIVSRQGLEALVTLSDHGLAQAMCPTGFDLGIDSWLELLRDPEYRPQMLAFDRQLRHTLSQELAQGQIEGWVRPSLNPEGASNLILALFNGLWFDHSTAIAVSDTTTAKAVADFFRVYVLMPSS